MKNPVGAGLPAIAVDQSPALFTDATPSLASQLPQGSGDVFSLTFRSIKPGICGR
jgi:hypothetical protein